MRILSRLIPVIGNVDQAMAALPAILDAAATSGMNAASIAGTLGRALSGTANTAESVGIVFDENATFAERLAQTLAKVGGAAEANIDPIQQMTNDLGDTKEAIGAALSPVLLPLIAQLGDVARSFGEWSEENPELIRTIGLVTVGVGALGLGLLTIGVVAPIAVTGFHVVGAGLVALNTITLAGVAATTALIARLLIIPTLAGLGLSAVNTFAAITGREEDFLTPEGQKVWRERGGIGGRGLGFGDVPAIFGAEAKGQATQLLDSINFINDAMASLDNTLAVDFDVASRDALKTLEGLGVGFDSLGGKAATAAEKAATAADLMRIETLTRGTDARIKRHAFERLGTADDPDPGFTSMAHRLAQASRRALVQEIEPLKEIKTRLLEFARGSAQVTVRQNEMTEAVLAAGEGGDRLREGINQANGELVPFTTNMDIAAIAARKYKDMLLEVVEAVDAVVDAVTGPTVNPLLAFESNLTPWVDKGGVPSIGGRAAGAGQNQLFSPAAIGALRAAMKAPDVAEDFSAAEFLGGWNRTSQTNTYTYGGGGNIYIDGAQVNSMLGQSAEDGS